MNEPKIKVAGRQLSFGPGFRKVNPDFFAVGGLSSAERKSKDSPALDKNASPKKRSGNRLAGSRAVLRIGLVAYTARRLDDDNLIAGCKGLRDSIASWIGIDDSEEFIHWEYGQCWTSGRTGVAVRIEIL